jgi:ATP-dependent Zn protease
MSIHACLFIYIHVNDGDDDDNDDDNDDILFLLDNKEVEGALDHRLSVLEELFDQVLGERSQSAEYSLYKSLGTQLKDIEDLHMTKINDMSIIRQRNNDAWWYPFLVLVVIMIILFIILFLIYRRMNVFRIRKSGSHLL